MIQSDFTARRRCIIDGTVAGFLFQFLQEILTILKYPNKSFDRSIVENLGLLVPRLEHLCKKSSTTWKT